MNIMLIVILFFALIVLSIAMTQVTVLSPLSVKEKINAVNPELNLTIPNILGNFGDVPYGKTLTGYLVLLKNTDQTNYWCNPSTIVPNFHMTPGLVPIILVDHSLDCPYSKKAYHVRLMGGAMMMLVSDNKTLSDNYNSDNEFGYVPDIPTIIIPKHIGEIFKDSLEKNIGVDQKVIVSVKFNAVTDKANLQLELFFRSDDVKALGFFKEFQSYAERLKGKMTFSPVYKYNKYEYKSEGNVIDDLLNPCVKGYCTGKNNELRIVHAKIVLLENIRQSCIYLLLPQEDYWNYMVSFFELCADIYTPSFDIKCSENAMKTSGIYGSLDNINLCMEKQKNGTNMKIEQDYNLYQSKKVYRVPELIINGIKYRGSWHGRYIFNAICNGFIQDEDVCRPQSVEEIKSSGYSNVKIFFTVVIILIIALVILLICYRRIVDKAINNDYNTMVQEHTFSAIQQNQYKMSQVKSENA